MKTACKSRSLKIMGMLGAFQKDEKQRATLIPLHDDVSEHLIATRRALLKRIEAQKEQSNG